jgi:hypothetical protein
MISAGFEHGGNVLQRHLDGHSNLLVYPFESQLGNSDYKDFLSSIERVQYRYPEFPENLSENELYEMIIDEELKTFLRKRNGSKFKDVNLLLDEKIRKDIFIKSLSSMSKTRKNVISCFFYSTFAAWDNYYLKNKDNKTYVGYSPGIGIDSNRLINDFPNIRILHVVRNPFSAYRDTKRRPFPQEIKKYLITWNIYHSTVSMYEKNFPKNVKIVKYEDLIEDKEIFMKDLSLFLEIPFEKAMLYPSWNSIELKDNIAPWGTVLKSTKEYNYSIINELNSSEISIIKNSTLPLTKYFGYQDSPYLKYLYDK